MVGLMLLGLVSYLGFLVATLPARALRHVAELPPQIVHLSGTAWNGAAMTRGGFAAGWTIDPWASVLELAVIADWTLAGPDTRLSGRARIGPGRYRLEGVSGVAGWPLVAAALSGLPFACDPNARVELERLEVDPAGFDAAGRLSTGAGVCREPPPSGAPVAVPALVGQLRSVQGGVHLGVAARERPEIALGELLVHAEGRLIVTVHPAGAALVPGMPSSGASIVEIPVPFIARSPPVH